MTTRTLQELKRKLKRMGIRQQDVADAADVHRTMVVNVFAQRTTSRNVLRTAKRLIAERRQGNSGTPPGAQEKP